MYLRYLTVILFLVLNTGTAISQPGNASHTNGTVNPKLSGIQTVSATVNVEPPNTGSVLSANQKNKTDVEAPEKSGRLKPSGLSRNSIDKNECDSVIYNAYRKAKVAYYIAAEKENQAYSLYLDSLYHHRYWDLSNGREVIHRQQSISTIIFIMVILLVLSGLVFSFIQFYIALKTAKNKGFTPTTIKASMSGVEVSSSILGVIILTFSLLFFYLYIKEVYHLVSL